ncbi:hypothetical protein HK103_007057 [Boothiomyces macroporosus]|uniref:BZIP domain-containing protein n=1 Tax=Boothiomyces macroporosus TaxID=261099 RepID=A0AAD5Y496_9FUNG|nr:hypothetical protein HK103_007057 [Boothiomyces macroporosus]
MSVENDTYQRQPPANSDEKVTRDTTEYTPQAEHLQNSPVTKISPTKGEFPDTTGAEAEFKDICNKLKGPVQMVLKKPIIWSKKDPLHFWQSLAFILRSEELTCIAVSSFVDTLGLNKLYIASNDPMTDSQQQEITEIINLFLDLKPMNEIASKLLPRHWSYITKQFKKINLAQLESFSQEFPSQLSNAVGAMFYSKTFSMDNIGALMDLITENRKVLCAMKDGTTQDTSETTRKLAAHLLKMIKLSEEISFIWKKVQSHQQDESLKSLEKQFQFVSLNCHAELALLKTAKDCCKSKTLYIGVSKRPCYCCSLFFKAITENAGTDFQISIVTTHGKLYANWARIVNCFETEFNQVWAKVIEDKSTLEKHLLQQTDDNSSVSGSSSDEDNIANLSPLAKLECQNLPFPTPPTHIQDSQAVPPDNPIDNHLLSFEEFFNDPFATNTYSLDDFLNEQPITAENLFGYSPSTIAASPLQSISTPAPSIVNTPLQKPRKRKSIVGQKKRKEQTLNHEQLLADIEEKRKRNTDSARRSRERKALRVLELERQLAASENQRKIIQQQLDQLIAEKKAWQLRDSMLPTELL